MTRDTMLAAGLGALLCFVAFAAVPAHAAIPGGPVPEWLLGEWAVTAAYQDIGADFSLGDRVPKRRLPGRTMAVTRDRLSLGGEVCQDPSVHASFGSLAKLTYEIMGFNLHQLRLPPRPRRVRYLRIDCGRNFTDGVERDIKLSWYIVVNSCDNISMPFLAGAFVDLRRSAAGLRPP